MQKRTLSEIRLHNARLLQDSVGGQKGMIEKTGKSQSQISAIMGENPSRNIGNKLAKLLEDTFALPDGWMDHWHDTIDGDAQPSIYIREAEKSPFGSNRPVYVAIPVLDVHLAAGFGTVVDREEVTQWTEIPHEFIASDGLSALSLAAVHISGDSMTPRLQNGDRVLIDTADKQIKDGKVYAIAVEDELRVKRLFKKIGGGILISSDNKADPAYRDELITPQDEHHLRVIGRVVRIISGAL
ncbi:hypothetical protein C4K68_07675 [Pokkaliibacter plantistimulans]|uniref:Peptidase S24/S26A/S26B/S26C domain-containing protein n=1 Tax=Proteobacteria bacterium 228 TaxID=2083153 RepID=A0A2S5KUI7_9PROT|nr:S24 family peptidase [Pokkaliibacter plantistimulans]PPC77916.1 hypothetical protein C4K68_07675 [Pokkaliibacter plantistimulans]